MIPAIDAIQDSPSLPSCPSVQTPPSQPPDPTQSDNTPASISHPSHSTDPPAASLAPEAANPQSEIPNPQSDVPLLTAEERRQILARIARLNPLDCFDASGAFDLDRARHILPPGSIRHITVRETTRPNAEGQSVTERRIDVSLFNPVAAVRLDDQIERRNERPAAHSKSHSDPYANFNINSRKGFNLLKEKTMALDDTLQEIEDLKKTLAGMDEEELRLNGELEEINRQLSETLGSSDESQIKSNVDGETTERSPHAVREAGFATPLNANSQTPHAVGTPTLQSRNQEAQGNTAHQPAGPKRPNPSLKPPAPGSAEGQPACGAEKLQTPDSTAGKPSEKREPIEVRLRKIEIEHRRNTSGPLGFALWLRAKQAEWAEIDAQALHAKRHPTQPKKTVAGQPARPPP